MGGFDAIYNSKNISIFFSYNPNPANHVPHPVKVTRNGQPLQNWDSYICGFPDEKCPIKGYKLDISGQWDGDNSFEAYEINLISSASRSSRTAKNKFTKPSFDCTQARTLVEKTICSDETLSALDYSLSKSYQDALAKSNDPEMLKTEQRAWLKSRRNKCLNNVCLQQEYNERLSALEAYSED